MSSSRRAAAGFTLIELLLVISIMAILAGLVLPNGNPAARDQLLSTARIVASDMMYARSLAVTYASSYRIAFDATGNRYILTNSEGKTLPASVFTGSQDTSTQHVVDLDELPHLGSPARLLAVARGAGLATPVTDVEFNSLGGTTQSGTTRIWLVAGTGSDTRYINVDINPVTGLTRIGNFTAQSPPSSLLPATKTSH